MSILCSIILHIALVLSAPLNVSLEASWRNPGPELLTLQAISAFNPTAYFPLVTELLQQKRQNSDSDNTQLDLELLEHAETAGFLDTDTIKLVKQELALGTALPALEWQFDLFDKLEDDIKEYPVIMLFDGKYITSADALEDVATKQSDASIPLNEHDHVLGDGPSKVLVYADFDSHEFSQWHLKLVNYALSGKITYAIRVIPPAAKDKLSLAGYAATYEQPKTSLSEEELGLLRHHIVSKIQKLRGGAVKKFNTLKSILYNIPDHVSKFLDAASDSEVDNYAALEEESVIPGISVNGLRLSNYDLHLFANVVRDEALTLTRLSKFLPKVKNIKKLLSTDFNPGKHNSKPRRYNLISVPNTIGWVNDIELDDEFYGDLDEDLSAIKLSEGPFAPVKYNIHSFVVSGDLNDPLTLEILGSALRMTSPATPVQVGLVSSTPAWSRITKLGRSARQAFLMYLIAGNNIETAEKKVLAAETEIIGEEEVMRKIEEPAGSVLKWMANFGVSEGCSVFANGYPLSINDWIRESITIFKEDMEYLRTVKPNTQLRDSLFGLGKARRNPFLEPVKPFPLSPWPNTRALISFVESDVPENTIKHSVVVMSSFDTSHVYDLVISLLDRSESHHDIDIHIIPLKGIEKRFYAALCDKRYNTYNFAKDLFFASKSFLFEHTTMPKIFEAAALPEVPIDTLLDLEDSVIIDGRMVPISKKMTTEVLSKLIDAESARVRNIHKKVPGISGKALALLGYASESRVESTIQNWDIELHEDSKGPQVDISIDTLSFDSQQIIALADYAIGAGLGVRIKLLRHFDRGYSNKYYSPVLNTNSMAKLPISSKSNLDYTKVNLLTPPTWTVAASTNQLNSNLVSYELSNLVISGGSIGDLSADTPIALFDLNGRELAGTVIMLNLNYYQLNAPSPGAYKVCVTDPSKSLISNDGQLHACKEVLVTSFTEPKVILEIFNRRSDEPLVSKQKRYESSINVFTTPVGKFEELQALKMIESVLKSTKHTVSLWLLDSFTSPEFKSSVAALSNELNFQVHYTSFKWPSWLRIPDQSDIHRIIDGYKVLFLDVLFPTQVKNVVFIDSRLTVRTDLYNLLNFDLQGAPYAFPPIGEDKYICEGCDFWKGGYWKQLLLDRGLAYHSSDMFFVDLDTFRSDGIGNVLREQYQALTQKEGNLVKLDQDLVNDVQDKAFIYTLPKEWLQSVHWRDTDTYQSALIVNEGAEDPEADAPFDDDDYELLNEKLSNVEEQELKDSDSHDEL